MTVIEIAVKNPASPSSMKSPAQVRLESRAGECRSPKSPAQIQATLENAESNRKAFLQARAEKNREAFEKAKTICTQQQQAFTEMTNKIATDIQTRLESAQSVRVAATEKITEKAGVEYVKAKEAHAKKQQSLQCAGQEKDEKIREKLTAAEERRLAILNEQKGKAAAIVSHAKDVAAQQQEKESIMREELRKEIQTKLESAETRRASVGTPSKLARGNAANSPAHKSSPAVAAEAPASPAPAE